MADIVISRLKWLESIEHPPGEALIGAKEEGGALPQKELS
jgi:hypothetical protein